MKITRCDGCGRELRDSDIVLAGRRANGMGGAGMPEGDFHLCATCGQVAFGALAQRRATPAAARP